MQIKSEGFDFRCFPFTRGLAAIVGAAFLVAGCAGGGGGNGGVDDDVDGEIKQRGSDEGWKAQYPVPPVENPGTCVSNKLFFVEQVWTPVLSNNCVVCHSTLGAAKDSRFVLEDAYQTGFLDRNLETFAEVAQYSKNGVPLMVLKPLGLDNHGGGIRVTEGSAEHNALIAMIDRVQNPVSCPETTPEDLFKGVTYSDAVSTLRKVRLSLTGTLPTEEEIEIAKTEGIPGLPGLLDVILTEPGFYKWLKEVYNDQFLTDKYVDGNRALNRLDSDDFPDKMWFEDCDVDKHPQCLNSEFAETAPSHTNWSVAQAPLELIAHIVRNDIPFTEIVTADYMMVNPYSAKVFSAKDVYFNDPIGVDEFRPAKLTISNEEGDEVAIPHAGVLTSPMWLNRFPTTDTNVNRHRSRMVYQFFLATDVLKLAERGIDQTKIKAHNPTMNEAACAVCHVVVDPVAGAFQNWDAKGRYRPPAEGWFAEMRPPGFAQASIDYDDSHRSLQWLAEHIVADRRFVTSVVHTMFRGLIGQNPLSPPSDPQATDYSLKLSLYLAQDAFFKSIGDAFEADNYNLKTVIKKLVLSAYFRADNLEPAALKPNAFKTQPQLSALNEVGMGRLLTPEKLSRKIRSITGFGWIDPVSGDDKLTTDYLLFYGGINSNNVTKRANVISGIMVNVAERMANELACTVVPMDFVLPVEERRLFPEVEFDYAPVEKHGFRVPAMVEKIKLNIQYLHQRLLGEQVIEGTPEFERTYDLFLNVLEKGRELIDAEISDTALPEACQVTVDPVTGEELPEEQRLTHDPDYSVRAWMAVISYLLSDYRFLYE